ncbi:Protein of unknown function [Tenacibaculum sp. MAR_2009_124]|uniref:DUF1800 family protein n=1 Tax=Tenacibaculum sp. MAR_2009_124 TaxID=1250059 RepID=UPI0008997DC3|nr:DUF1800 family protein [Tenacibaculum sp. MAR_2009_124]SEB36717.1 Protein of unknown function [Tenacibaculum sp. MAR_2009_124]
MNGLQQYTQVLGLRKAKHLLRRTSFDYTIETLNEFAELTPEQAFSKLTESQNTEWTEPYDPLPNGSPDGNWTSSSENPNTFNGQGRKRRIVTSWWWYNTINKCSLKAKLTFFLHTSFTVSKDEGAGSSTHFFDHLRLVESFAFGNVKTLAKKITFDNSMLNYLDNTQNNANNPNENYAREFLELFTILKGPQNGSGDYTNYTEHDIQQTAKVFSGIKTQADRSIIDSDTNLPKGRVAINQHDQNDKIFSEAFNEHTILGKNTEEGIVGELDEYVEMVFSMDATAISYCRKLYRFFVKSEWNEDVENNIIIPLAVQLKNDNYEILPTLKTLLTSNHFYDLDDSNGTDEILGSIIKSPLQLISETISFFKLDIPHPLNNDGYFYTFFNFIHNSYLAAAGMNLWGPDSVAGYPAHYQEPDFDRHWFSSNTVLSRYKMIDSLITGRNKVGNNGRIRAELNLPDFIKTNISNPSNATELITELSDYLYIESINNERKDYFAENLLEGFPDYYWTNAWLQYEGTGDDTIVKSRLNALITRMINAPEFQLM